MLEEANLALEEIFYHAKYTTVYTTDNPFPKNIFFITFIK